MKRKTFIITATATAAVAVGVPVAYKKFFGKKHYSPLIMPEMLGKFCDEQTIRHIGKSYMKKFPAENTREKLTDLLLTDDTGKKTKSSDTDAISNLMSTKAQNDFAAYRLFDLEGWIVSVTEARQCALFSFT